MHVRVRPLLALAVAGAALAAPPAASASTNCFGPSDMYVCVVTPKVTLGEHTECVYVGGTTCRDVTVPWVNSSGSVGYYCGGRLACN